MALEFGDALLGPALLGFEFVARMGKALEGGCRLHLGVTQGGQAVGRDGLRGRRAGLLLGVRSATAFRSSAACRSEDAACSRASANPMANSRASRRRISAERLLYREACRPCRFRLSTWVSELAAARPRRGADCPRLP